MGNYDSRNNNQSFTKNCKTPIHKARNISNLLGVDIRFKRDDLFPMWGGGNKARMMYYTIAEIKKQKYNAIVTAGSTQSNFARVSALTAASYGWRCRIILHGSKNELADPKGNLLLMLLAGAEVEIVEKNQIRNYVKKSIEEFTKDGYKPFEIHGDENIIGSFAYYEAFYETMEQLAEEGWVPDYLIHASGTGTTQAGIITGKKGTLSDIKVIGISVARKHPRGSRKVLEKCEMLTRFLGMDMIIPPKDIVFRDDWIGDGYGFANKKIKKVINFLARYEGIIVDPTYTGKALIGLLEMINHEEINKGSRILFWHTGGLINLLASDHIWENTQ